MSALSQVTKKQMFQDRWGRLYEAMETEHLDTLIVAARGVIGAFGNVFFLCGYTPLLRVSYGVLHRGAEPILFVPSHSDELIARNRGIVSEVRSSGEMEVVRAELSTAQAIAREVTSHGARRVGIVGLGQIVPLADYTTLQQELASVELIDASGLYARIKERKTADDLEYVRAAFDLAHQAYEAAGGLISPGVRAQEVVAELEKTLRTNGGMDTLVFVDSSTQWVRRTTDTVFAAGDLVMVLVEVATEAGYFVEQGGLFSLGEPSTDARTVADACYQALSGIHEVIAPGVPVTTVTDTHEEIGRQAGLELGLSLGHGIGVDHDLPTLYRTDPSAFSAGQVISVHPYYWHPNGKIFGGAGDAFHVTETGNERLGSHEYRVTVL